tara:strand:- start:8623 stop:8958 length:336 start_codon:yes stop_codon:yes gene_type:complete
MDDLSFLVDISLLGNYYFIAGCVTAIVVEKNMPVYDETKSTSALTIEVMATIGVCAIAAYALMTIISNNAPLLQQGRKVHGGMFFGLALALMLMNSNLTDKVLEVSDRLQQ